MRARCRASPTSSGHGLPEDQDPRSGLEREKGIKLSLIATVEIDCELFFSVHGHNMQGSDITAFLRKLQKEEKGRKMLVVWDGTSSISMSQCGISLITMIWPTGCPEYEREMHRVITAELRKLAPQSDRVASAMRNTKDSPSHQYRITNPKMKSVLGISFSTNMGDNENLLSKQRAKRTAFIINFRGNLTR